MSKYRRLAALIMPAIAVTLLGCPSNNQRLFDPTSATLPAPDPDDVVQAEFNSFDGRARISVFPGTALPPAGLTIETIAPGEEDSAISSPDNETGARLGPDGAQFNMPVRVSILVGQVIQAKAGEDIVPTLTAFTNKNGAEAEVPDVETEVTEDGLLIANMLLSHFSDVMVRAGAGVTVGIRSPADGSEHMVGATIQTGLMVTNNADAAIRLKNRQRVRAPLANINSDNSEVPLAAMTSTFMGDGTCNCTSEGFGIVNFQVIGDRKTEGPINPSLLRYSRFVNVDCVSIRGEMTVTFNPNTHTTHYSAKAFKKSVTGHETEITTDFHVKYRWTTASVCGAFDNPGDDYRNFYNHTDCSAADEEKARVKLTVTYTNDDGNSVSIAYDAGARANEGAGPIGF